MRHKLAFMLTASFLQTATAINSQINNQYPNGEKITLQTPIPQKLYKKFGIGWESAELTNTHGEKIALYPENAKTKDTEKNMHGIIWGEFIPNTTSPNGRHTVLNIIEFAKIFKNNKPELIDRNYCFFIELRTGCVVKIETGSVCSGRWENDEIWHGMDYDINISKIERPKITSLLNEIEDKSNTSAANLLINRGIYFNMQNYLTCDKISQKSIEKYITLNKYLEYSTPGKSKLLAALENFNKTANSTAVLYPVSSNQAYLFNSPTENAINNSYLTKGDQIQLIDTSQLENGWCKVKYTTKTGKIVEKWMKATDLDLQ